MRIKLIISVLFVSLLASSAKADDAIVIADFDGTTYGDWKATGDAFGSGPARGTLNGQMSVEGFQGAGLVNSFNGGDGGTGKLTSPPVKIERRFITFLIGGGGWADETCMNLLVDGQVVRTAVGPNTVSGGSERLEPAAWDVSDLLGKKATIEIVDAARGGWGHINVDHIVATNDKGNAPVVAPPKPIVRNAERKMAIDQPWLMLPVKNGAKSRVVTIEAGGKVVRKFDIELADAEADWFAPLDVRAWQGQELTVRVNVLPADSAALQSMRTSSEGHDKTELYQERLRPLIHFTPRRGWMNDPNGLVYYGGEYHLFFQHNPYGTNWGNMHWGHATSPDLVHWQEHGEALYPDDLGTMFSGSAVVDWKNTSGFGRDGKVPLVLMYTAAGDPTTQCIAWSLDGRTFTKYSGNPVIAQVTPGNRDPKVFW